MPTRNLNTLNLAAPALAALLACASFNAAALGQVVTVATFDELPLAPESYFDPEVTTTFKSGGGSFGHSFIEFFPNCCWSEFTYSNVTDVTTPGFSVPGNDNDASAYALPGGGGAGGSANYAIGAFADSTFLMSTPRIDFAAPRRILSAEITNTTYTALSILNGDGFNDAFTDGDFLLLHINGKDAADNLVSSVEIVLADYRLATPLLLDDWTLFDLTPLGAVSALEFTMSASQAGTPFYFALDNLASVPLPGAAVLFAPPLALLGAVRKKNARR